MRKWALVLSLCSLPLLGLNSQSLEDVSFSHQPIESIFRVLGAMGEFTVSLDPGILHRESSFYSPGMDAREAANHLLNKLNLYGTWENDVLWVSHIVTGRDDSNQVYLNAEGATPQEIILALLREFEVPIIFKDLPTEPLTFHLRKKDLKDVLQIVVTALPNHELRMDSGNFQILRKQTVRGSGFGGQARGGVLERNGMYGFDFEHRKFTEILDEFFTLAEQEYSYLGRHSALIPRMKFQHRPFKEALRLLMEQGKSDFLEMNGIFYVFDATGENPLQRYFQTHRRPLKFLTAREALSLFPTGMLPSQVCRLDESGNALVFHASQEILAPLLHFLDELDQPDSQRFRQRYDLDFLRPEVIEGLLPHDLGMVEIHGIPDSLSFVALATEEQHRELRVWLDLIDCSPQGYPVALKYITAQDFLPHLPPPFLSTDFRSTQNPNLVFFLGSSDRLHVLKRMLRKMDVPKPQIRYDLLVIQYQDSSESDWDPGISIKHGTEGTAFTGALSPLLDVGFDIATTFGYQFALELSASITESRAKVVADTSLNGLSGEAVRFRNTHTFRYQDSQQDGNGNLILTTEKQITSGLFIDISGWVSGDDMITMDVQTTISKQLSSGDLSGTRLPPTSEKVIDTHIRTPAGQPVIIGGLTQQEESLGSRRVPGIGSIPGLGFLFKRQEETVENTEFVVYIVPHIETNHDQQRGEEELFERIYINYFQG